MEKETTGINPQQLESWKKIIPTLKGSYKCIIEFLISVGGSATSGDIAKALNKPLHSISGRLTELNEKKILKDSGQRVPNLQTNRMVTLWELNHEDTVRLLSSLKHGASTGQSAAVETAT